MSTSSGEWRTASASTAARASSFGTARAVNSPVEASRTAIPVRSGPGATAIRYRACGASSMAPSTSVPGVTTRTTSRFTSPFAFFGSSICSAIATR